MKINITKEQVEGFGKAGLKIGKAIVFEGTKALALKGAAAVINTSFNEGFESVKDLTLDDIIDGKKGKKDKSKKRHLFKNKEVIEVETDDTEVTVKSV